VQSEVAQKLLPDPHCRWAVRSVHHSQNSRRLGKRVDERRDGNGREMNNVSFHFVQDESVDAAALRGGMGCGVRNDTRGRNAVIRDVLRHVRGLQSYSRIKTPVGL
jgi:hypothetical protein